LKRRGGFNLGEVKEIFRIFNWQSLPYQEPQVWDRIEELLKLRGTRWPSPEIRKSLIEDKVFIILDLVMATFGWIAGHASRDETRAAQACSRRMKV
jgi:hypothetical protein